MRDEQDPFKDAVDVPLINLQTIDWPDVEHYGFDHHKSIAFISRHISMTLGCKKRDQDILWIAAILHDIGRKKPFGMSDVGHDIISADMAHKFLKADPSYHGDIELIENVCKMIANHSDVKDENLTNDPKFLALLDADVFEVARISPKTTTGLRAIKDTYKTDKMRTDFGRDRAAFRGWMKHRGW